MSDQLSVTDVGVGILVLKVFVDFAKFAIEKISERRNGNSNKQSSPSQIGLSQSIRDIHTSVVTPDRTPLHVKITQLERQLERRRRN